MQELEKILIVEDDSTIRSLLEMALLGAGYRHVSTAARGDEGLAEARRIVPDLVLLDVMLPGLDGFSIARRIRETPELSATRIIMVTARVESDDICRGLDAGADDYVVKPFDRRVLLARVKAVLRRSHPQEPETFDGLALDVPSRRAVLNGAELKLAPGEFKILVLLAENRGRVLTRERILDHVQSDGAQATTERTVDVQIANLRRKLGEWSDHIETLRGIGYRVK